MPRPRVHATAADRQRAYRARLASRLPKPPSPPKRSARRPPSRPARLAALAQGVDDLLGEYQAWFEALPESMKDGSQADKLRETIESLEEAAELLGAIDPPRGFGRDQ